MPQSEITYRLTRGDDEFELDVEYSLSPYDPGNTFGLPEDCEPPSGGEVDELTVTHAGEPFQLTQAETEALEQHIYETHDYDADREDHHD